MRCNKVFLGRACCDRQENDVDRRLGQPTKSPPIPMVLLQSIGSAVITRVAVFFVERHGGRRASSATP